MPTESYFGSSFFSLRESIAFSVRLPIIVIRSPDGSEISLLESLLPLSSENVISSSAALEYLPIRSAATEGSPIFFITLKMFMRNGITFCEAMNMVNYKKILAYRCQKTVFADKYRLFDVYIL